MTRTLNEITQDIAKYHEALNASGGDVVIAARSLGMTQEEFEKSYDALAFEDANKLDAYLYRLEQSKSREAAAQEMVNQWSERIKQWAIQVKAEQRDQEWMKSRLKMNMQVKGETKIITADGRTISIEKNGGKVPLVVNEEAYTPDDVDEKYVKVVKEFNKEAIRESLEKSEVLYFAVLGERSTCLRIY